MVRVPSINRERDKLIAYLERKLREFESIPAHRREAELADIRAEGVRDLLDELKASAPRPDGG